MIERIEDSGPPLSDIDIARAESRLGVRFPRQYKDFLRRNNGGRPIPDCFPCGPSNDSSLSYFFEIYDGPDALDLRENVEDAREGSYMPPEYIPIAHDAFSNLVCIIVEGPGVGEVYFLEHHLTEPSSLTKIADDFDSFCASFFDIPDHLLEEFQE